MAKEITVFGTIHALPENLGIECEVSAQYWGNDDTRQVVLFQLEIELLHNLGKMLPAWKDRKVDVKFSENPKQIVFDGLIVGTWGVWTLEDEIKSLAAVDASLKTHA